MRQGTKLNAQEKRRNKRVGHHRLLNTAAREKVQPAYVSNESTNLGTNLEN